METGSGSRRAAQFVGRVGALAVALGVGVNTVTNTITVGNQTRGVTVSPDGTRAYVAKASFGVVVLGNTVAV